MSLVVCSNQSQDGQMARNRNSISKPWAFKNTLSSTYTIPKNAQVALTSCKVNIPERVVVGGNQNKFYQFIGNKRTIANDGALPGIRGVGEHNTSYPVKVNLTLDDDDRGTYEDLSPADFAERLQTRLQQTTYHPNYKELTTAKLSVNASTQAFQGYEIGYETSKSASNVDYVSATDDSYNQWYREDGPYADKSNNFTYKGSTGEFIRTNTSGTELDGGGIAAGINIERPLSCAAGELVVNVSGTSLLANSAGVEWHVGLSRSIRSLSTDPSWDGFYIPPYVLPPASGYGDDLETTQDVYADFAVCRNQASELVLYQYVVSPSLIIQKTEVKYWLNSNSSFSGAARFDLSSGVGYDTLERVKLEVDGEQVAAYLYDSKTSAYLLITKYAVGQQDDSYFKPVTQACWCLHPVLAVGRKNGAEVCKLQVRSFGSKYITGYNPNVKNGGGWYENNEILGLSNDSYELDRRPVNASGGGPAGASYIQTGLVTQAIPYSAVLILGESNLYAPSNGANSQILLGFSKSVLDVPTTVALPLQTFLSTTVPSLAPMFSIFLKLNNLGQQSVNALTGNQSKIISHLTDFEDKTGRLTYEPANLLYLDLNNPAPLNITEFDLSFSYINEQFAEILTGQSIVTLSFRKKPESLM